MTDKAYIVTNEQQEHEVLEKLEREGYVWVSGGEKPTEWSPSRWGNDGYSFFKFPYALELNNGLSWTSYITEDNYDIVFDGRKESKMKISKDIYDALVEWRDANHLDHTHINGGDILRLPTFILNFWLELGISQNEANNRLIAIIRWVNGEDVFEVEKPKKWIVRSKETDGVNRNFYVNVSPDKTWFGTTVEKGLATQFDTKEEADKYVNSLTESVPYK